MYTIPSITGGNSSHVWRLEGETVLMKVSLRGTGEISTICIVYREIFRIEKPSRDKKLWRKKQDLKTLKPFGKNYMKNSFIFIGVESFLSGHNILVQEGETLE